MPVRAVYILVRRSGLSANRSLVAMVTEFHAYIAYDLPREWTIDELGFEYDFEACFSGYQMKRENCGLHRVEPFVSRIMTILFVVEYSHLGKSKDSEKNSARIQKYAIVLLEKQKSVWQSIVVFRFIFYCTWRHVSRSFGNLFGRCRALSGKRNCVKIDFFNNVHRFEKSCRRVYGFLQFFFL